jgi:hypothetical protein
VHAAGVEGVVERVLRARVGKAGASWSGMEQVGLGRVV